MMHLKMFELFFLPLVFATGLQNSINDNLFKFTQMETEQDINEHGEIYINKCVTELIKEWIDHLGSTYVLMEDEEQQKKLLHNLRINFVHSYFKDPKYLDYLRADSHYNTLIFGNKFTLTQVIQKKKPSQDTKFFILVKNYKDVIKKFKILWENRLVNVVATYVANSTAYYYTYYPYCSKHCGRVGEPFLVGQCNVYTGVFSHKKQLYPIKVHDLHKCPVKITLTKSLPASYSTVGKNVTGWEVDLLNEILKRINGVPNYKMLHSRKGIYRKTKGYNRLVEKSEVGAGLVISLKSLVKTDFCMYGMSLCATWILPRKEDTMFSANFLIEVFSLSTWLLLFLTYFTMATAIRAFFEVQYGNVLFKLLPFLLGNTTRTKRTSRRFSFLWLWFCLMINAIYQSGFQSSLLVPDIPEQLSTTQHILESDLKIIGLSDIITDTFPYFKRRYNLSSRRLSGRQLSYEDWIYSMTVKKDSAYLGFKETVLYQIEHTELANKIYIPDDCVIKYLVAFVLKKNSHLTETVVKLANRLNENGFLIFFVRKHFSKKPKHKIPAILQRFLNPLNVNGYNEIPPPISMKKINVVFLCLFCGNSLGFIAFTWELMFHKYQKYLNKLKETILRKMQHAWTFKN